MARNIFYNKAKLGFLPVFSSFSNSDKLDYKTPTEQVADPSKATVETGWERVKRLFSVDEFGNITPEVNSVLQTAFLSSFCGMIYGGTIHSKQAYEQFMKNQQATSFATHFEAKKKLQQAVTISFGKGGFRWSWRLALFSSTFVGTLVLIQAYRGKYGILEYVSAGAISGFLYKFNSGPRAWIVAGGLGSVLGLIGGGLTQGLLGLSGLTMEETRYWQYKWNTSRKEYFRKGMEKHLEEKDFAVIKLHDDEVGEKGRSLDNLDPDSKVDK